MRLWLIGVWPVCRQSDDLRVYNRALLPEEIAAESFPSLGMLEPGFAIFGCDQCLFDVAVKACPPFYHLCYKVRSHDFLRLPNLLASLTWRLSPVGRTVSRSDFYREEDGLDTPVNTVLGE